MASCAVPGFMPAIAWDDMILGDGGIVGFIPNQKARLPHLK
ncbi:MAG: hypothetical protein PVJ41_13350 [Desulfobacterales bacterium]